MNKFLFLGLFIAIGPCIYAQQEDNAVVDIFEHEGLLDLKNRDLTSVTSGGALIIQKMDFEQYSAIEIEKNSEQSVYLVEEQNTFDPLSAANMDSVIDMLQTGRISGINNFTDPLYLDTAYTGSMENFAGMCRKALGNLLNFQLLKRETLFIRAKKRTYGVVTTKARFAKASGMLTLYFRLSDAGKYGLAKIAFVPFSDQQNAFIKTISLNDIRFIQASDYKRLEQDFTEEFTTKLGKGMAKFETGLSKYQVSDSLLTFRLFTRNRQIFVMPVFYTNKPQEVLSLRYAVANKKLLIDMLVIINER